MSLEKLIFLIRKKISSKLGRTERACSQKYEKLFKPAHKSTKEIVENITPMTIVANIELTDSQMRTIATEHLQQVIQKSLVKYLETIK